MLTWIPTAEMGQVGLKIRLYACVIQAHNSNITWVTCNVDWGVSSYSSVPLNKFWDSTSIMWRLLPSKSFPKSSFIHHHFMRRYGFQLPTQALIINEKESSRTNSYRRNLFCKSTFCRKDSNFCSYWIKMRISRTHLPRVSSTITDRTSNKHRAMLFPQMLFQPRYFCDISHSITIETAYRFHPYR
jgi:hypothetical protein